MKSCFNIFIGFSARQNLLIHEHFEKFYLISLKIFFRCPLLKKFLVDKNKFLFIKIILGVFEIFWKKRNPKNLTLFMHKYNTWLYHSRMVKKKIINYLFRIVSILSIYVFSYFLITAFTASLFKKSTQKYKKHHFRCQYILLIFFEITFIFIFIKKR